MACRVETAPTTRAAPLTTKTATPDPKPVTAVATKSPTKTATPVPTGAVTRLWSSSALHESACFIFDLVYARAA